MVDVTLSASLAISPIVTRKVVLTTKKKTLIAKKIAVRPMIATIKIATTRIPLDPHGETRVIGRYLPDMLRVSSNAIKSFR